MNVIIFSAIAILVVLVMFVIAYSEIRRELPRAGTGKGPRADTEERPRQKKAA